MNLSKNEKLLFDEVKRYLSITWNDEYTDQTISDFIEDGKNHLINLSGDSSIDFFTDKEAKKMLKDYCRYARNNSVEYFNANFADDILRFQINHAVEDYSESSNV